MSTLLIEGGHRLSGSVAVEGNKNAALPLLAACLLTTDECVLTNVPRISDVEVMARLLLDLGAHVEGIGSTTLRVRCPEIVKDEPDGALVGRLRGSVLLLGPLLARRGRAQLAPPGGDFPARRTLATHIESLEAMGARVMPGPRPRSRGARWPAPDLDVSLRGVGDGHRNGAAGRGGGGRPLRNPSRRLRAARRGVVSIPRKARRRASREPERRPFASKGAGSCAAREHQLWGDYIEAGSWAVVAAITGGEIEIRDVRGEDMEVIAAVLKRMNIQLRDGRRCLPRRAVAPAGRPPHYDGLWPGFPSDMVSLVTVLSTQAEGQTLVHDWLYELRLFALEQLHSMSADLFLCDPTASLSAARGACVAGRWTAVTCGPAWP